MIIDESWTCGNCGEPLVLRPALDVVTVFLGQPALVTVDVTCEGDNCQSPHNVIPIPFMGREAKRIGIFVLEDDTNPEDGVWMAAAKAGAVIGTIGGYELKWSGDGDVRVLMGVVWFTSDEVDPERVLIEDWGADITDRELVAQFAA